MGEVTINSVKYTVLHDSALPSGRRGLSRRTRAAQSSDPGRIRTATWKVSGPIGASRESTEGFLGHDHSDLETRYNDLLTSPAARNALTLSTLDPGGTGTVYGDNYGSGVFGPAYSAVNANFIEEDRGEWYFHRGRASTHVNPSTPALIETDIQPGVVEGAKPWKGQGYVGLGHTAQMVRRVVSNSTKATYEPVSVSGVAIYANALEVGTDRLWMVHADPALIENNRVRYTLDGFSSIGNPFVVGDDGIPATGLGTLGPYMAIGSEVGSFSFTAAGASVRIIEALKGHQSANNGTHIEPLWGWQYTVTDLGLYAWDGGTVVNPVGPESLTDFEGPIDGRPTALHPWRDSLLCAYRTTGGDTYILRGMFDDGQWGGNTAATGRPAWFVFRLQSLTEVDAIFSSGQRTNPTIMWGEGTNAAWALMGRRGRDIADGNYVSGTDGGTWFGSVLMRDNQMLKNVRYGKFVTENLDANNTWRLAVSVDGGSYVNVGSAVTSNGSQTVFPVSGGAPLTTVNGQTIKPRLTQVAASSSSPPQIRGTLEIGYDERPDQIEEVNVVFHLGQRGSKAETAYDALFTLANNTTASPDAIRIADGDITDSYGFVVDVGDYQDVKGDDNMSCTVRLHLWDVS